MTFVQFARSMGLDLDVVERFGAVCRCRTFLKPHKKNGAYLAFGDGGGWVIAYDGDGELHWFNDPDAKPMTEAEKARHEAKRQVYRDERDHLQRQAADWAAKMLTLARPAEHGYLQFKGLKAIPGLVLPEGELFVPMRDVNTNTLLGAQIVQWLPEERRWEKKYLYGMRSKGAVLRLGPPRAAETILCEGYATALSIEAATRQMRLNAAVLVTFSAHNLIHAASRTTGRRYVIADHDAPQRDPEKARQNPGEAGQRAAIATGLGWAMPDTEGMDANDLHAKDGLMAVCALVMRARRAEPVNPWAVDAEAVA